MRPVLLAMVVLFYTGCDDAGETKVPDGKLAHDGLVADSSTPDSTQADASQAEAELVDASQAESIPADGPASLCTPWQDSGWDCCDVCTLIYVTCKLTVKNKLAKVLTGKECLTTCDAALGAQPFFACLYSSTGPTCDATKLQTCFGMM